MARRDLGTKVYSKFKATEKNGDGSFGEVRSRKRTLGGKGLRIVVKKDLAQRVHEKENVQ